MRRKRYAIEDLRRAIDCLPVETRAAMLEGVRSNDIIVGAYTTRDGGVCPMLAAHRCGGRASMISFAPPRGRVTQGKRGRPAAGRGLRILTAHLQASPLSRQLPPLREVVLAHRTRLEHNAAEHGEIRRVEQAEKAEPVRPEPRPTGERDRTAELAGREGWA